MGEDGAELHCGVCDVRATSEEQLASHREGKRHARHLAMAELTLAMGAHPGPGQGLSGEEAADAEALRCDLCQVTAPTPVHKEVHLRCAPPATGQACMGVCMAERVVLGHSVGDACKAKFVTSARAWQAGGAQSAWRCLI